MNTTIEIRDEREDHARYAAYANDRLIGWAEWVLMRDTVLLPYVEVDPAYRDLGIGSTLVRRVLDDVRAEQRTAVPICSFARRWAQLHLDYRDVTRVLRSAESGAARTSLAAAETLRHLDAQRG